jgi:hypothetical protein
MQVLNGINTLPDVPRTATIRRPAGRRATTDQVAKAPMMRQ